MKKTELLQKLRSDLFRSGVNRFSVRKFVEDWDDHLSTHIERSELYERSARDAEAEALAAFGEPDKVVKTALQQVRKSTLAGRQPLVFLVLILLLFFISVFVLYCVAGLILEHFETHLSEQTIASTVKGAGLLPEIIAFVCIFVFALYRPSGWRWLFVSAIVISWAGTLPFMDFSSSVKTGGESVCRFGLGFVGIDGFFFRKIAMHYDLFNHVPRDTSLMRYLKCESFSIAVGTFIFGMWLYHFLRDPFRSNTAGLSH